MDDWQEAALTNRHLHNRVGKQGRGRGGKSNGGFDVQSMLGTYEVKCPAAGKLVKESGSETGIGKLEVYHLNEQGNALVGELFLPNVLHATVLMTGSRKTMNVVVRSFETQEDNESDSEDGQDVAQASSKKQEPDGRVAAEEGEEEIEGEPEADEEEEQGEEEGEEEAGEEEESGRFEDDDHENRRYKEFEKNSFRSPKFWMKWQGLILAVLPEKGQKSHEIGADTPGQRMAASEAVATGNGYLVFAGNKCIKFQGTLSCETLGWNNVKVHGWKLRVHTARDFQVHWQTQS